MANSAKHMNQYVYKCPSHGVFRGYQWLGHARHCKDAQKRGVCISKPDHATKSTTPMSKAAKLVEGPQCPRHGRIASHLWAGHLHDCTAAREKYRGESQKLIQKILHKPVVGLVQAAKPVVDIKSDDAGLLGTAKAQLEAVAAELAHASSTINDLQKKIPALVKSQRQLKQVVKIMSR